MVLALQTPTGPSFVKDWPAQNTVNCDLIDGYAGPCLTTNPLLDYVPVLTASVTDPTLGTGGTLVGKYYKIFDQIYVWGEFRFGTGATIGSGVYRISLPFRAKTGLAVGSPFSNLVPVGNGIVFSAASDSTRQPIIVNLGNPDYLVFTVKMGTAGSKAVTHNSPVTWSGGTPGDGIMWSAKYQREP